MSLALCFSLGTLAQPASPKPVTPLESVVFDNTLITAQGQPQVYLLKGGLKYCIQNFQGSGKSGFGGAVHVLSPAEVAAIPEGYDLREGDPAPGSAEALDNHLVLGDDHKLWAVFGGERHWILNGNTVKLKPFSTFILTKVPQEDIDKIHLGSNINYIEPETATSIACIACAIFALILLMTDVRLRRKFERGHPHAFYARVFHGRALAVRWGLFVIFVVAMAFREPNLLLQPRFWAEEGTVWFAFGSTHSVAKTLFMVYPASSYFNLAANIGAVLSSATAVFFGLVHAPAATTCLAFIIQTVPIALIVFGKSRLFDSLWKVVLGCGIYLFVSTTVDEVWLNSINSMSFLGLVALLLAFEETWIWPNWLKWESRALLLLCGLSSPYAIALFPVFAIVMWHDKKREQKIQCLLLLVCLVIQGAVVLHVQKLTRADSKSKAVFKRGSSFSLERASMIIFLGQMVNPAVGPDFLNDVVGDLDIESAWLWASTNVKLDEPKVTAGWVCFLLAAATLWSLRAPGRYSTTNLVLASFLILAIFTSIGSLYGIAIGRYALLPGIAFMLLLLLNCERTDSYVLRLGCAAVLSVGLAEGVVHYTTAQSQVGPPWQQEVVAWNNDHNYPLHVWPGWWETMIYREHQHRR